MKAKNEKTVSIISAILFLLLALKNFWETGSQIALVSEGKNGFIPADIMCYISWVAIGISAIITAILLLKNKKSKLLSVFAITNIIACAFNVCTSIMSVFGIYSDFYYPLFFKGDSIIKVLGYMIPRAVGFAAYIILLVYILRSCGSSQKKEAEKGRAWLLSGVMIIAEYLVYKIMLTTAVLIDAGPDLALRILIGYHPYDLISNIVSVLISAFAVITLCLWFKRKNNIEAEIETDEFEEITE